MAAKIMDKLKKDQKSKEVEHLLRAQKVFLQNQLNRVKFDITKRPSIDSEYRRPGKFEIQSAL